MEEVRAALGSVVYVDTMGAALYPHSRARRAVTGDNGLTPTLYGGYLANPHSTHGLGRATGSVVDDARVEVLRFFGAESEYEVVFTSNASHSMKIVAEWFPWDETTSFVCTRECHNSVLGMRTYAEAHGAKYMTIPTDDLRESSKIILPQQLTGLFAFPAECNFSGKRLSITETTRRIKNSSPAMSVLVDGAAIAGKLPIRLDESDVDFFVCSFYKFLGFPTGVGALLIRKDAVALQKKHFAGGTVKFSLAEGVGYSLRDTNRYEALEDGTLNFHGICHVKAMMAQYVIPTHVDALAEQFHNELCSAFQNRVLVYGWDDAHHGTIVAFNLMDSHGHHIGYGTVEQLALSYNIHLRVGCFCNPGACSAYVGLSENDMVRNAKEGKVCWDSFDVMHGAPTGAVRVSFGAYSSSEDVRLVMKFLTECFLRTDAVPRAMSSSTKTNPPLFVKSLHIYPIKGMEGITLSSCNLLQTGLEYDRGWLLKTKAGVTVTPLTHPSLRRLRLSLLSDHIAVSSPGMKTTLKIPLKNNNELLSKDCGIWFSTALKTCGIELLRAPPGTSAANTSPLLVVYETSYLDLLHHIPIANRNQVSLFRSFRPNVVVGGGGEDDAWAEESWRSLSVGGNVELGVQERCKRCLRVNAAEDCEPLRTLVSLRHHEGRTNFGVLCNVVRVLPRGDRKVVERSSLPMPRFVFIPHMFFIGLVGPLVGILFGFLVSIILTVVLAGWCYSRQSKKTPAITLGEYDISIGTSVEAHY